MKIFSELENWQIPYVLSRVFNAKIENEEQQQDSKYIGKYSLENRNERGDMLVNFLCTEKLYRMNTFFKKQPQRNGHGAA